MEHQEDAKINMPTDTPIDLRPPTPAPHPPLPTDPIDSDLLRPRVSVDIPSARTSGEADRASGSPQGTGTVYPSNPPLFSETYSTSATNSSTSNQSPPHKHSPLPIPKPRLPSTRLFHSQTSPLSPRPRRRSLDGASSLPSLGRLDENPSSWILLRKSQLTGGAGRGGKRRDTASDSNIQQRESLDGEDSSAASIGHS
ncbi:hypothetical protein BDN72DRAFT_161868 [Pluteus cervinus]|uniref:Uncharacterized protein n=1 Tax=Pluteus cervinus TaxID=181527 RepID=A0ACD3AKD1_9AGAR|nr:hypothetical protein BDN72DRAFT_161868 [Pluteus cervinus]